MVCLNGRKNHYKTMENPLKNLERFSKGVCLRDFARFLGEISMVLKWFSEVFVFLARLF